jgi:small subunit ribosomal protein S18
MIVARQRSASGPRPGGGKGMRRPMRRKVCRFCVDKAEAVDYKNINLLRSFITERGKILAGRVTGNCAKHQRCLTVAIERARNIALLPYTIV